MEGNSLARKLLSDRQWECLALALQGDSRKGGRSLLQANRNTVEGILWIDRTGAPRRDLLPKRERSRDQSRGD